MLNLKASPLSRIEHSEALRKMPIHRRVQYTFLYNTLILLIFVLLCALSIVILLPIIESSIPRRWTLGDYILVGISIVATFFVAIGFTGSELPEHITPKDTVLNTILRAGRFGLVTGFCVGFVFGLIWAFAVRIGLLYVQLNTIYGQTVFIEDLLRYGALMAIFIAPMFALFRMSTSGLSYGLLWFLRKRV